MATLVLEVMNAFLGKSDRVISPKMARLMLTKQVDVPPDALGMPLGNGLGVFIDTSTEEVCFLHPGHNSPGTTFVFVAYPSLGKVPSSRRTAISGTGCTWKYWPVSPSSTSGQRAAV